MLFFNDIFFLLPEIFWTLTVVSLLVFSTTLTNQFRVLLLPRLGGIFIFFLLCFAVLYLQMPVIEYALVNYQYVSDFFTLSFKLAFLIILLICLYVSLDYCFFERIFFVEYYFLIGFFCISSFLLISANDLVIFYLAIELQALILYTFAALKRYTVFSTESGLKYFVLGAFSSGLLLFSISLFYGFWGLLSFYEVKFLFLNWLDASGYYAALLAIIFLLSSLLFKLAAAPFHIWVPDVYEGSPSFVVLIFATLPKLAVIAFSIRLFVYFLYEYSFLWYMILIFSGLMSVLLGTVVALNQLNIKRLYAYSAIVNVGYLMTAAAYGTTESFSVLVNYLVIYLLSTVAIFVTILAFRKVAGLKKIKYLPEYSVYSAYNSAFSVLLGLLFFSLAGVPPLAGFFIKFFLFKMIFALDFLLNPVIFVILITSVASAFYYIRVVRFVFFDGGRSPVLFKRVNYFIIFFFVVLCLFLSTFFFFQPAFFAIGECLVLALYL